ncbi:bifunctional 2-polyprenyl-6-hydroxyphenol methylase/3-demethylubiquinol 3-O-methyltransferase UbiG [Lutibacter sp. B1]|uniref:class I SAM-dependent methyltransferase n=1 Tax=Lutibacter sp. B1 TaxID=2725996 RepID=UPI001456FD31|nr:class I SAM-dependent methyltransferase [Lutibacter sp. B1]NLP58135.1 class I SAM-dependent methyltransferase [Lutibacter sp. B1]
MTNNKDWFASWFDTCYYHILYKHRDYTEAQEFMQNLISFLNLKKGDLLLDLACGKGRHSIYLNSLGFNVVGADLSKNSIQFAKQFENDTLKFVEHDMRDPFKTKFNAILNLFTSFGFFEDDTEDIAILQNIKNGLKPNGIAVIDFLNVKNVIANLIPEEVQTIDNITFNIKRYVKNGFIIKEINFDDNGKHHTYFEKVKCLNLSKINSYVKAVGFRIKHTFGNYYLDEFNEETSDRLILILE